ncbi:hypothetical protein NEOLEDRAFT_509554 [Neolentinus lepideus HHB14362 ss-1]|uniref:E3 ubiquitin-protein ligase PEP5 n=1 Tax=Neolentinus lepideus HHB14362 ss-1 TaxID=1314782 RepID=A0A165RLB0_9AGAM|nr:hypothetical protein NEOLEDRAFT_509554 [Neolentinus lepideus HHB14362 ss-1]
MSSPISANASAAPAWRQFPFFDAVPVKDVHDLASPPEIFKSAMEISIMAPSTSGVLVADIHGSIHLLDKDFETVTSWLAHVGGRVTHMAEQRGILITLGEEDAVKHPLLKIWELGRIDQKTGAPNLLRSVKVQHTQRPHPVSTVALSASLSHLAVGLGDGTVLLYRHLDQSLFSGSTSLTSVPKPRVIHESPAEPTTGLGFREPGTGKDDSSPNLYLFIVTTNRVLCYQASGKGSGGSPSVVHEVGCGLGCATMDWKKRDVIVAREEAIYMCGTEGRGQCYAYEGSKSSVHTHLNYLVIVSPPFAPSASAASATVRNFVARSNTANTTDITKVTVFDPENKFVAYTSTFTEGIREVISQWGNVYILSNDGNLICLQEKPTAAKLDMMYQKGQYLLALNVAKTQRLDESSVADIHRQYGDHLYGKSDYDGAMQQYLQTLGYLQASYVIRKFLDAQRIHNLVTYLQELHSVGLANSDHTTLLLNTYTKLKDVSRLDSFIKTESRRTSTLDGEKDELPFDLDTAIRVCRQAGYFEHASYLAKKYERHEDYLRIQIEDAANYKDALSYLRQLGSEAAEANLARYGRAMLESLPDETTQLLIGLCTSTGPLSADSDERPSSARQPSPNTGASYLSYLALNRTTAAPPTVSSDNAGTVTPSASTIKAREQPSRRDSGVFEGSDSRTSTPGPERGPTLSKLMLPTPVKRPSPRLYFAHFVDHLDKFVVFLETVALKRWGQTVDESQIQSVPTVIEPPADEDVDKQDQVAVWNTLLELYLSLPSADSPGNNGQSNSLRDKALLVLKSSKIPYDSTHALILCSTQQYTPGLLLLWEKMGMYEEVLRFWMDKDKEGVSSEASGQVIKCLDQYGPANRHLYPLVLRFLTSTPALLSRHASDLGRILDYIDNEKIMPPLGVIQVLSRNGVASVGLVKQWLLTRIKESREEVQTDKQLTDSYRMETKTKLKQVDELSDPERPRVFHVTRCSSCGGQLDLPSVHFMCNHSYHQRCLADHDTECPNCARANGVIREIRRNNERLADQHDLFLSDVKESGFDAIASAYGRSVLNASRPVDA